MKRYRDYKLYCKNGQSPTELLDKIEQVSIEKSYKTTRKSSFVNSRDMMEKDNISTIPLVIVTSV